MRRLFQLAVMVAVALAVPASPLVLAQIQKGDAARDSMDAYKASMKGAKADAKVGDAKKAPVVEVKKLVEPQDPVRPAIKVQRNLGVMEQRVVLHANDMANPNLEPQIRQFTQQFRPAMRSEYYFLKSICAPTAEQRVVMAREGEKAVRAAAKAFAEAQRRPAQVRNGRAVYPDPRRLIEEEMARSARDHLTPGQAERYVAESEKRTADRHRAAARNIVAKLDQDLILSADQRARIAESMIQQWDESWCQSLETLLYGDQYYPRLPDNIVLPHLDETQARIWRHGAPNQHFFFGSVGNMMPPEDPREDKELIEARLAAERSQPMLPGPRAGIPNFVLEPAIPAAAPAPAPDVKMAPAKKMKMMAPARKK